MPWGYIIRDDVGGVIQSGAGRVDFACDPLHMELKACIQGVCAAIELGISHLVLETDAQQVVWAVQGDEYRLSMMGGLMHELKELLPENFVVSHVIYAPHECNRVAHELATIGRVCQEAEPLVMGNVPDCIQYSVSSDLADMVD
jgi:ribonuclease HI